MVWFGGLYVYSLFVSANLTIIVLYMGEKFSFCVFLIVVIYRVVFCQDVKCPPMYGYLSVGYWIYAANDYSLFDMRVDMISASFALWSVIKIRLR